MDWMDFNGDGKVDETEEFFGMEMLCGDRKEHEELFGDSDYYDGDSGDDYDD